MFKGKLQNFDFFSGSFKSLIIAGTIIGSGFIVNHYISTNDNQIKQVSEKQEHISPSKFAAKYVLGQIDKTQALQMIDNYKEYQNFISESVDPELKKLYSDYMKNDDRTVYITQEGIKITEGDLKSNMIGQTSEIKKNSIQEFISHEQTKYSKFINPDYNQKMQNKIIEAAVLYYNTANPEERMYNHLEEEQAIARIIAQHIGIAKMETGHIGNNPTAFSPTLAFGVVQILSSMENVHSMKMIIENQIFINKMSLKDYKGLSSHDKVLKLANKLEKLYTNSTGKKWSNKHKQEQIDNIESYIKRGAHALSKNSDQINYLGGLGEEGNYFKDFRDKNLETESDRLNMAIKTFEFMLKVENQLLISNFLLEDLVSTSIQKLGKDASPERIQKEISKRYNGDNNEMVESKTGRVIKVKEHYAKGTLKETNKYMSFNKDTGMMIAINDKTYSNDYAASYKH